MKLEFENLAPYLPYAVHLMNDYGRWHNTTLNKSISIYQMLEMKPILRPLSDLFKDGRIRYLRELCCNDMMLWSLNGFKGDLTNVDIYKKDLTFDSLDYLYRNHFDIFGLIEQGLAIDINKIES